MQTMSESAQLFLLKTQILPYILRYLVGLISLRNSAGETCNVSILYRGMITIILGNCKFQLAKTQLTSQLRASTLDFVSA
jgi:hypothetical protein